MCDTTQVILRISSHEGYAPSQIETRVTLSQLLEEVEIAIEEYGGEATIVLDNGQRYGASYGRITDTGYGNFFTDANTDEDEEDTL